MTSEKAVPAGSSAGWSPEPSEAELAAATLVNSVGSLVDQVIAASAQTRIGISSGMEVSPSRLSQIENGDGNLRVSTLGRLLWATGHRVRLTADVRDGDGRIEVPRPSRRRVRTAESVSGLAPGEGDTLRDDASLGVMPELSEAVMAAASLSNAVGSLIDQMVELSGMAKKDVATGMGVTPARVSQILAGDGNVRMSTLGRIAHACGFALRLTAMDVESGAEISVPRQARRRRVSAEEPTPPVAPVAPVVDMAAARRRMREIAPVKELVDRGYLPAAEAEQPEAFCQLFGLQALSDEPRFLAAARRHNRDEKESLKQMAWLACARRKAASVENVPPFDVDGLRSLTERLSRTVTEGVKFRGLPSQFADVGVRLVFEAPFPGGKISGASFLLDDDPHQPVIALSGRGKHFDKVFFTLVHECAHAVLGHLAPGEVVIDERASGAGGIREDAADAQASSWALPFAMEIPDQITEDWIAAEVERQGVHRSVVAGRLQHEGRLAWGSPKAGLPEDVLIHLESWS